MDLLIAALLVIIALLQLIGRPFKIEIYHKHPPIEIAEVTSVDKVKEDEEAESLKGFTSAIAAINAFMTGEEVPDDRKPSK